MNENEIRNFHFEDLQFLIPLWTFWWRCDMLVLTEWDILMDKGGTHLCMCIQTCYLLFIVSHPKGSTISIKQGWHIPGRHSWARHRLASRYDKVSELSCLCFPHSILLGDIFTAMALHKLSNTQVQSIQLFDRATTNPLSTGARGGRRLGWRGTYSAAFTLAVTSQVLLQINTQLISNETSDRAWIS